MGHTVVKNMAALARDLIAQLMGAPVAETKSYRDDDVRRLCGGAVTGC